MKRTIVDMKYPRSVEYSADTKSLKTLVLAVFCVLAIMIAPAARGQATGSFSGNVIDKSGSGIPGAAVTVTSQATGQVRAAKTDDAGHYLVPLLPVGVYTVHVDAASFQSAETRELRLQVDEARELDFTLVPATKSNNKGWGRCKAAWCGHKDRDQNGLGYSPREHSDFRRLFGIRPL